MDGLQKISSLIRKIERFISPDGLERIVEKAVDSEDQYMIELNRQQLEDGTLSDGSQLPPYSPTTVQIKREKGQQTQPMNLRDTGSFQAKFQVKKYDRYKEIFSTDPVAIELDKRYGANINGLTQENIEKVRDRIRPKVESQVNKLFKR